MKREFCKFGKILKVDRERREKSLIFSVPHQFCERESGSTV